MHTRRVLCVLIMYTQPQEFGGACSFSFALARGFFCGTGRATGGVVMPPDRVCPDPSHHKYLVRGQTSHVRSLWKCAPCVKYLPLQYRGLMQCGFRLRDGASPVPGKNASNARPVGTPDSFSPLDVVESVKEFIRTKIHAEFSQLHDDVAFPNLKYRGEASEPAFPGDGRIAYVRLQPLSFAADYAVWDNAGAQDCPAGLDVGGSPADGEDCSWFQQYDASAQKRQDDLYQNKIGTLKCTVESPKPFEYSQCASIGAEPRDILRTWVDSYYRTKQGNELITCVATLRATSMYLLCIRPN